ncbi:MAG: dimethyl sulfoxide reductase anchor subunit [Desulfovibrio sp.]|jgi:anaerobic dimethyl sulfoxide reductase subunit C (anchor subunit)|nr:dimethyl sulfoxide reductase anchor subunit [Desulfovibrio sp.]
MSEWSLLFFTLALQVAAGTFIALALKENLGGTATRCAEIVTATIVALVGVIFSFTHLGDISGAFHALSNVGTSWLSREIWLVIVFILLALICIQRVKQSARVKMPLVLVALTGVLAVYASAAVYANTVMEQWVTRCPYADFFATTLLLGPILAAGLCAEHKDIQVLRLLFALGVFLFIVNVGFYGSSLQGLIAVARLTLTALGILVGFWTLCGSSIKKMAYVAVAVLLLGEGMGRYIFFMA